MCVFTSGGWVAWESFGGGAGCSCWNGETERRKHIFLPFAPDNNEQMSDRKLGEGSLKDVKMDSIYRSDFERNQTLPMASFKHSSAATLTSASWGLFG